MNDLYIVEITDFTDGQKFLRSESHLQIKFDALDMFIALREQGINVKRVKRRDKGEGQTELK